MDMVSLKASPRDAQAKVRALRRAGSVPCVVYGFEVKDLHIQCEAMALHKAFRKAGESSLVELEVEGGKKIPVLFKDIQFDPVSGLEIHADFYAVNMKQEIDAPVHIRFEGESVAVKDEGGIFVVAHSEVKVRCLPKDLPHDLVINISGMTAFHATVSVKDIEVPKGVTILDGADTVVATIQEPRKEEVIAPPVVEAVPGAEGAAAAPGTEGAPAAGAEGAAPAAAAGKEGGKEKK